MASSDIDKANVLALHFAQQCSDPYTTDPDHTPSAGAPTLCKMNIPLLPSLQYTAMKS